ncbi:MAG: 3-hydroxylacyl-ACP dehydratase [Gammaproteobacteria bacterium]|nr:3-hydroxylacyl-ACP dehydratase [Gammaproteobacteria bacterium]MBV8307941.1 3-hydroxylacyl-ACP dehydratase [Gammaproteobacteria bacterium]
MPLDHEWIEQHIPHKGRMCLLDEVLSWDAGRIRCRSASHRARDNPLRAHGRLGAACGIEYAAQAMAVHGALIASSAPLASTVAVSVRGSIASMGYLASVRNVALHVSRLDDLEVDLIAIAERITGDGRTVLYEFSVWGTPRLLMSGRASIVFDAAFGAAAAHS